VVTELSEVLKGLTFNKIVGLPYAGIPLAVAVGFSNCLSAIVLRKESQGHGAGRLIDGDFEEGQIVAVVDDVITTGGTKIEMAAPLLAAGLTINDVVVLVDREQGGRRDLEAAGYELHSVFTLRELITHFGETEQIDAETSRTVLEYLEGQ